MDVYQDDGVTALVGAAPIFDYYRALSETSPFFSNVITPPTILEIGTGSDRKGTYGFIPVLVGAQAIKWRIDFGSGANPRKFDGSFRYEDWNGDLLPGLADLNSHMDQVTYNAVGSMVSARQRVYDSKTNAQTHGAAGLLATYTITSTYDASGLLMATYMKVQES